MALNWLSRVRSLQSRLSRNGRQQRNGKRNQRFSRPGLEGLEPRLALARDLLLADHGTDSILRYDGNTGVPLGAFVASGSNGLVDPHDPIFGPDGNLYVVSNAPGARKILRFDGDTGESLGTFIETGSGGFNGATAITFGPNGDLYVATGGPSVLRYDGSTGAFRGHAASSNGIQRACGVEFGPEGSLYVLDADSSADTTYDRILRFDPDTGQFLNVFVQPGSLEDACQFTFGPDGHVYVPDLKLKQTRGFNGTTGQLQQIFRRDGELIESFAFDVVFGPGGNAFVPTAERILRYDGETGEFLNTFVEGDGGAITFFPPDTTATDLSVTDLRVPIGVVQGYDLSVTYTVTNNGPRTTSVDEWVDVVYLSTDAIFDPSDQQLGRITRIGSLAVGASYTETVTAPLPATPLGNYHVLIFADRRGMTNDAARSNNLRRADQSLEVFAPLASSHVSDHSIAVGRTMSAYTTAGLNSNELTITYTVYNLTDGFAESALLTTTLAPDISFVTASQLPDRSGQMLAWSLGRLTPFGRASVQVTVARSGLAETEIDLGPRAFASIDTVAVFDDLRPATLRTDVIDNTSLSATPDANSGDPIIQAKAAELNQDAMQIVQYLTHEIGFESYVGSLRGARGTLWSGAGNALDEASLGVALMRASGIPARYAQGTLSDPLAQELILSMFPETSQLVGFVPDGTDVADPAHDPRLLAETRRHFWFQFDTHGSFVDADTAFTNAPVGETNSAVDGTFVEVPDAYRHKARIQLAPETFNTASGLFGGLGGGLSKKIVLDQPFNLVDLVGRSITIGNIVTSHSLGALTLTSTTINYAPYVRVADVVTDDPLREDELIRGQDYQEFLTNFPFGSQLLTGLFLDVILVSPTTEGNRHTDTVHKTLLDRLGFDVRNASSPASIDLSEPRAAISSLDLITLQISGQSEPESATTRLVSQLQRQLAELTAIRNQPSSIDRLNGLTKENLTAINSLFGKNFLVRSDAIADSLSAFFVGKTYFSSPRLIAVSSKFEFDDERQVGEMRHQIDLLRDSPRILASPQQSEVVEEMLHFVRGFADSVIEGEVLSIGRGAPTATSAMSTFLAAVDLHGSKVFLGRSDFNTLDALQIPTEAKARISTALLDGHAVVAPASAVQIGGGQAFAWLELDPTTGDIFAVAQDGSHGGTIDYTAAHDIASTQIAAAEAGGTQVAAVTAAEIAANEGGVLIVEAAEQAALQKFGAHVARDVLKEFVIDALFQYEKDVLKGILDNLPPTQPGVLTEISEKYFKPAFTKRLGKIAQWVRADPPLADFLLGDDSATTSSAAVLTAVTAPTLLAGTVQGNLSVPSLTVMGDLTATWSTSTAHELFVTDISAATATVVNENGETVGIGAVSLTLPDGMTSMFSGTAQYMVQGKGKLSFHAGISDDPAHIKVGGNWVHYTGTVTGEVSIAVESSALQLNGNVLPAGTYVIRMADASLVGRGATSSPNFARNVSIRATDATVSLSAGEGNLTAGGHLLVSRGGSTFTNFQGTIEVTAGDNRGLHEVALSGSAQHALTLDGNPNNSTTNHNTPVTINTNFQTSLAGAYTVVAEAPEGWSVTISNAGIITLTPAPGLQGGSHVVQLLARSATNPELLTHAQVTINLMPTAPELELSVQPDELFYVDIEGGQLESVFRAEIGNRGPRPETVELSFANLPADFDVFVARDQITIPAGETGVLGFHLMPTGLVPPPGTRLSFEVLASNTDGTLIETETVSFVITEVHGVRLSSDPPELTTTPGLPIQTVLVLESRGNVTEVVDLTVEASSGLTVTGVTPVSLSPGELKVLFLTLTPSAGTRLNSTLTAAITATFNGREPATLVIPVTLATPGVESINRAKLTAERFGHLDLANRLEDLGIAITNLAQQPELQVYNRQAVANLDSIFTLLAQDPILVQYVDDLSGPRNRLADAQTPNEMLAVLQDLGAVLDGFDDAVFYANEFNFELILNPNSRAAQPNVPIQYELLIHHIGGVSAGTYNIGLSGLPSSVTAELSDTQITLDRDDFESVFLTIAQNNDDGLLSFDFSINVSVEGYPEITKSVLGSLMEREEFVSVASVDATPPFGDAGEFMDVSVRVLNAVNRAQLARASFVVKDGNGVEVRPPSPPVDFALTVQASLADVALGCIDTTGLAEGSYTIEVVLTDVNGEPIPGATGHGTILIGSPLHTTLEMAPQLLPPGTHTVGNVLELEATSFPLEPPTLVGQRAVPGAGDVIRNGDFLYVSGSSGITVLNIAGANVDNPQLVRVVGSGTSLLRMRGNLLVSTLSRPGGGSTRLETFSLDNPSNPTLLGSLEVPYGSASDVVLTDTHAFVVIVNLVFATGSDVRSQNGGLFAVNLSNPAAPFLDGDATMPPVNNPARRDGVNDGVLFNDNGANNDGIGVVLGFDLSGGNQMTWSAILVSPTILYVVGSSATGTDTQNGIGLVRVVDISEPRNMRLLRDLSVPGTVHILDIAVERDRALVTGTAQGLADFTPGIPFTGNVVQATLDLTDPRNPQLITTAELDLAARGIDHNVALGGGLFAFGSLGPSGDTPGLFLVNVHDPGTFIKTAVPAGILGMSSSEDLIFTANGSSVMVYRLVNPPPLTLVGFEPIAGGQNRGVAARNDIAYVCSANGIQVIDYSDPANPIVRGTVGSGINIGCRLQDDLLLAERELAGRQWQLDVYSIHNDRLSPTLLGSTSPINYTNNTSGLESTSTHAFLTQQTVCFVTGSNDIYVHMGELFSLALNLDNPANPTSAAPALVNVLFNTFGDSSPNSVVGDVSGCSQSGGDHNVFGVAMANPHTAYLAASSVVGTNTQAGIGRIHVVDVTNAGSPILVRNLDIPGTVQAVGIGISGDTAVVVGSTDGWVDPFTGLRNGNLTVTTLDLSDPLNPQIVAHHALPRRSRAFWTNAGSLGGKLFGFSSIDFTPPNSNNADLLLIDASNPKNPSVISTGIPLDAVPPNSISFDGEHIFTINGNGMSIYELNEIPMPVTTSIRIPNGTGVEVVPGSFNIPPTRILSGTEFDTLEWNLNLSTFHRFEQLTWETLVTDLQPGEARRVTLDSAVDFGFQGTPGRIILPANRVVAEQVLALAPSELTARPGEAATFTLTIENPGLVDVEYDLDVLGVPSTWVAIAEHLSVPAGGTVEVPVVLTSEPHAVLSEYGFVVRATTASVETSVEGKLVLLGEPLLPDAQAEAYGVVVELLQTLGTIGNGMSGHFPVRITNTGSEMDTFGLDDLDLPADFMASFHLGGAFVTSIEVPPGASNFRDLMLRIVPPSSVAAGDYPFAVLATSQTLPSAADAASGLLTVSNIGVRVELTPDSGVPESRFQMTVTNTGDVAETFDLSLAGTAAFVSTLAVTGLTLGVGQSQTVEIEVGGIDFALPGNMSLVGVATSRSEPVVRGVDEAFVSIDETQGLDAALIPSSVTLSEPATVNSLLRVDNRGNIEDAYRAEIVATSGPIRANLIGLDGLPATTVPLFRLPGLTQGRLLLQSQLLNYGIGTVTIRVQSLNDPSFRIDQIFTMTAESTNSPPIIISDGGGDSASLFVRENQTAVTRVMADDQDPGTTVVYDIAGGADAGKFSIAPNTGEVNFRLPPDFEVPTDEGANNVYEIVVRASDGLQTDTQLISVVVIDALELQSFDVQRGATQRSYIRHVDFVFDDFTQLEQLIQQGRIDLTRFDLNGDNGATVDLSGRLKQNGAALEVDFGVQGIGGNRNTNMGDGYYQFRMDLDGDGTKETAKSFYRLFGDVLNSASGARMVTEADVNAVNAALGKLGSNLEEDVNGDGVVNALDRTYATRAQGRRIADGLSLDD